VITARTALIELLEAEREWRCFFKACCQMSSLRLRSQTRQFQDELKDRGHKFEGEDLEDALFELARILLPESPAAKWDSEWAGELASEEVRRLAKRCVDGADLSVLEPWHEKVDAATEAEDRRAYREALRGYVKAGLEAVEAAKRVVA
jgi:hypothetical protein